MPETLAGREPQVRRIDWIADRALPFAELAEECRRRGGWDEHAWERILWHGGLYVNGRRVYEGELPASVEAGQTIVAYGFVNEPFDVRIDASVVLYDEAGVVAVNKPPHLTVQGTRATRRLSLETQLRELLACPTLTPVHRLDHGTSGINLFARDGAVAALLCRQFYERSVDKLYVAWVRPAPVEERWSVQGEIVQVSHPRHARYALVGQPVPGSRPSETDFVRREIRGAGALVEARPKTGRTHQIRIHLAEGGTPIIGDFLYGPPEDRTARLMLHAESITVRLPSGARRCFVAPPPADFQPPAQESDTPMIAPVP